MGTKAESVFDVFFFTYLRHLLDLQKQLDNHKSLKACKRLDNYSQNFETYDI